MAEVYLISTLEKVGKDGKNKVLKEADREYYVGNGVWSKNPLSARMHKPEALAKVAARATNLNMRPGYICGLIAGEQKFVVTLVVTPDALKELEKKREEELKEKKKQAALAKLSEEEKALLGIA